MERPVSMPPPRAESPRPIPPPRRDVPIKIAPVPGSRVESPRHSPRHASPRSSNSNGSPVGSSPRSSNTPLTSSVRVELSPKPLRTSLGGSQSAESSPRGETASSSEQRRSPRPSSAILSKSPRISTSPRPNSPYLQLVPSQPQSSLTEDFAFKSRALLRFFCRDAVNSSLPDELFTAFVPSCSLLSKSSNPPHLDLEVLLERELDRLPGEKVCRFDRLCSLVWSIDHHDEEVFVRAGRIVKIKGQNVGVVLECSVESELLPRLQGRVRRDVLRGCCFVGDERRETQGYPGGVHVGASRVVPGKHWGPVELLTCDQRGRPLALVCCLAGVVRCGGEQTEGILRQSAGAASVVALEQKLLKGHFGAAQEEKDPLVWGAVLKDLLLGSGGVVSEESMALPPKLLLNSLNKTHACVLREVLLLLLFLAQHEDSTRLSLHSLCLMLLPCLLSSSSPSPSSSSSLPLSPRCASALYAGMASSLVAVANHVGRGLLPLSHAYFVAANALLLAGE